MRSNILTFDTLTWKKLEYMTVVTAAQYYFSLRKCDMPYSITKKTFPMVLYSPICVFDIFFSIKIQYVSMLPMGNNMCCHQRNIVYWAFSCNEICADKFRHNVLRSGIVDCKQNRVLMEPPKLTVSFSLCHTVQWCTPKLVTIQKAKSGNDKQSK